MRKTTTGIVLLMVFIVTVSFNVRAEESGVVRYGDYGAKGDGVTNDAEAIAKAHLAANKAGLPVQADSGVTYYIGALAKTINIQTSTDWKDAKFIIDDSKISVKDRNRSIFSVSSPLPSQSVKGIKQLRRNQEELKMTFPYPSLISVTDKTTKRFIRYGANQNNGTAQTEVFVVDQNGKVDSRTPIIWDYDKISSIVAMPISPEKLTLHGGYFTTIANQAESNYTYYARGINIVRSNVLVDGVTHAVTGELDHGAPYGGFIVISNCAEVTVQNCKFSSHRYYRTIGNAKTSVSMGTYDISIGKACNITFKNCCQLNSIHDPKLWGVLGTNFTKNVTFDTVEFSRYDAHMGVTNVTIRNSSLGRQGINLIGTGSFLIENSKVFGSSFINLRGDYGSTFEGDVTIRNCEFTPRNGERTNAILIAGGNSGQHDFGYTCYMPKKITIDGLIIHDGNSADKKVGPRLFANFNRAFTNADYVEKYPYIKTQEVVISGLVTDSGRPYILSDNAFMFRNVKITEKKDSAL